MARTVICSTHVKATMLSYGRKTHFVADWQGEWLHTMRSEKDEAAASVHMHSKVHITGWYTNFAML